MNAAEAKENYNQLFCSIEDKAKAFDLIAEKYYCMNFGSLSKGDLDVLMFSIFIDKILDEGPSNFSSYSDYRLSKQLGITQARISNLKVKKELQYPYQNFDWRKSFLSISDRAIPENGKIKLLIPDKNLYLEVKNAIEEMGGFVEIQLTPNLLQVDLAFFLDLILAIDDKNTRDDVKNQIKEKIVKISKDVEFVNRQPIGKALLGKTPDLLIEIIGECIPVFGGVTKAIAKNLLVAVRQKEA